MIKKLTFSALVVIFFFVFLNLSFALYERAVYGAFWESGRPKGLYISKNADRPRLKPGAVLNGWKYKISINSLGFRGPDLESKASNGLRLWCVGGSTTFDIYAPDNEHTWPALLESHLQESLPQWQVEVINAGIPGEVYWGSKEDFLANLGATNPDVLMIYHGPNDLRKQANLGGGQMQPQQGQLQQGPGHQAQHGPGHQAQHGPGHQAQHGPGHQAQHGPGHQAQHGHQDKLASPPLFEPGQFALGRAFATWTQERQSIPGHWEQNLFTNDDFAAIENEVRELISIARQNGVLPVLITHPMRAQEGDQGTVLRERVAEASIHFQMLPSEVLRGFLMYNQMLRRIAQAESLPLIDLAVTVGADESLWGDATHFTASGSKLAADKLSTGLVPVLKQHFSK